MLKQSCSFLRQRAFSVNHFQTISISAPDIFLFNENWIRFHKWWISMILLQSARTALLSAIHSMTNLFSDLVPDCFIYMANSCHIWLPRSQYSFLSFYYIICSNFNTSKIRRNWSWNCAVPYRHTNIIYWYFACQWQPQYQRHFIISTDFSFGLLFANYAKCMWNCHHNTSEWVNH